MAPYSAGTCGKNSPNQPLSVLPTTNTLANMDHKPIYTRKLDTLARERYHKAIEDDNWDAIFDEENNEL